jgi:hypothetical protein
MYDSIPQVVAVGFYHVFVAMPFLEEMAIVHPQVSPHQGHI